MSFEKNFCPSPWFHMRINNTGNYEYCRWANKQDREREPGINELSPAIWFQKNISSIRQKMLDGVEVPGCYECRTMEQHGKVSGRQRQLLKIGVRTENFVSSLKSSPWLDTFTQTQQQNGDITLLPQDWQIDLGNYCNSACLFCNPHSSSRLAAEYKQLNIIQELPPSAWCNNPDSLETFLTTLESSPRLAYLHFIGGETLITPAFVKILKALIARGLNTQVSIGFTTNLTVWRDSTVDLLKQFQQVNLGMSIECLHPVNDYARYGGTLEKTKTIMEQWLEVARAHEWLVSLRTTPTILTVAHLYTVYEYALINKLTVESCNFLEDPVHMRPTVLPVEYKQAIVERLKIINSKLELSNNSQVINTRNHHQNSLQLSQDISSYISYLENTPDESYRLPELVAYLKKMESLRGNCVLDYLPEYEELFRTAGY